MLRSLRGTALLLASGIRLGACAASSCSMDTRSVPFVLLGSGGVGTALLEAIVTSRELHAQRYGIRLEALAVCDSSAAMSSASGLSNEDINLLIAHKAAGNKLSALRGSEAATITPRASEQSAADFLSGVAAECGAGAPGCIVVDCTATDASVPALLAGERVVSANKKPFADSPMDTFERLVLTPQGAARTRYEATVGAGLPVIAAVQRVVSSSDPVSLVSGSFSGTLGYVMSGLQEGRPFSEVVSTAKDLGYTEPDPRDDLGGVDVARKALILARTLGMRLELADVAVEPLYPAELAGLSVDEFMRALPTLDAGFAAKVAAAAAEGKVLRYAASVKPPSDAAPKGSLTVGLLAVPASSPLGTLSGSDNLVEVHTRWYSQTPLVLRGAGAGTGTTAAGVLADMIELGFTRD